MNKPEHFSSLLMRKAFNKGAPKDGFLRRYKIPAFVPTNSD